MRVNVCTSRSLVSGIDRLGIDAAKFDFFALVSFNPSDSTCFSMSGSAPRRSFRKSPDVVSRWSRRAEPKKLDHCASYLQEVSRSTHFRVCDYMCANRPILLQSSSNCRAGMSVVSYVSRVCVCERESV